MSATCSRVSWVDLCNEDEECADKWREPSSSLISNSGTNTPAPTPSKQLGDCLNNLHMITPLKDITAQEPIVGPIKFDLDETLNEPDNRGILKTTHENIDESDSKNSEIPRTNNVDIVDSDRCEVIISTDKDASAVNDIPSESFINGEKDCLVSVPVRVSSDESTLPLPMESKIENDQSVGSRSSNSKFDDSRKRTRRYSASSSATTSDSPRSKKANYELELDPVVIKRRQKQIDFGKNTLGYDCYIKAVPKDKRKKNHPATPPKHLKYSRRAFDGLVKIWRQELHNWDPKNENADNLDSESDSDEPSLDESLLLTD